MYLCWYSWRQKKCFILCDLSKYNNLYMFFSRVHVLEPERNLFFIFCCFRVWVLSDYPLENPVKK